MGYGVFHVAHALGVYINQNDWGNRFSQDVDALIKKIDNSDYDLYEYYTKTATLVDDIRNKLKDHHPIAVTFFKA